MIKLKDYDEAIAYLKEGAAVFLEDRTRIILGAKSVLLIKKGSRYKLGIEDFKELYAKSSFYCDDLKEVFIDDDKDREYYAFRHK